MNNPIVETFFDKKYNLKRGVDLSIFKRRSEQDSHEMVMWDILSSMKLEEDFVAKNLNKLNIYKLIYNHSITETVFSWKLNDLIQYIIDASDEIEFEERAEAFDYLTTSLNINVEKYLQKIYNYLNSQYYNYLTNAQDELLPINPKIVFIEQLEEILTTNYPNFAKEINLSYSSQDEDENVHNYLFNFSYILYLCCNENRPSVFSDIDCSKINYSSLLKAQVLFTEDIIETAKPRGCYMNLLVKTVNYNKEKM